MSYILPYVICVFLVPFVHCIDLNVGSVLFTKADTVKECWSNDNIALLTSRMILEDIIPSTSVLRVDNDLYITDLVDFFHLILEAVRKETTGKVKHVTLIALTDILGGYLNCAVIPMAKYAYYAGAITFDSFDSILGLFNELKWFLRTNGQGWATPRPQNTDHIPVHLLPLQLCASDPPDPCANIIVHSAGSDSGSDQNQQHQSEGESCDDLVVPVPFLDAVFGPRAVALPLHGQPVQALDVNTSAGVVADTFVLAHKCLESRHARPQSMERFRIEWGQWVEDEVVPRLEDDTVYPAFGGVLRIRATLAKFGRERINNKGGSHQVDSIPESINKNPSEDIEESRNFNNNNNNNNNNPGDSNLAPPPQPNQPIILVY